jgi:hypothetical protein
MKREPQIDTTEATNLILINVNKHLFLIEFLLLVALILLGIIAYRI